MFNAVLSWLCDVCGRGGGQKVREGVSVTMVMRQKSGNDDIRTAGSMVGDGERIGGRNGGRGLQGSGTDEGRRW